MNQQPQYKYFNNDTNSFNVNTTHPLIQSSQEYYIYKKFVSIHSEDRDPIKYPNSSDFEIELPEDMINVSSLELVSWAFPSNYNVFSKENNNILLSFLIINPYNPYQFDFDNLYYYRIYEALDFQKNIPYTFYIETGFYNPLQMTTELTNKMNYVVTNKLILYFNQKHIDFPTEGWDITLNQLKENGGYNRFVIVYNEVMAKIWFGNTSDQFEILSSYGFVQNQILSQSNCEYSSVVPDSSKYGLPSNLGLERNDAKSTCVNENVYSGDFETYNGITIPRFYYGDVNPGDNGYWLLPEQDLSGSLVYWIEPPYKINLMGEAYIYLEIGGQNCVDETQPFQLSEFTLTTNKTNGIVNSSFAKIPVPSTPLSQWFDKNSASFKFYYPPAERIRKLKFKLRYHNGQLVQFGVFNYSFLLQFNILLPMITRDQKAVYF
jgi:hypothetical protein